MKKYILFAGVNGAGKSTLYQVLDSIKDMPRVNTDEIVRSLGNWTNPQDVYTAGKMAVELIRQYFKDDISSNQETTLCGGSIFDANRWKPCREFCIIGEVGIRIFSLEQKFYLRKNF